MNYEFSIFAFGSIKKTLVFVTLLSANLYAENQRKKESKSCESDLVVVMHMMGYRDL